MICQWYINYKRIMVDGLMTWHWYIATIIHLTITLHNNNQSLDQVGRVSTVFPTGDVRVSVNGRVWTFNPMCLIPAPDENPPEVTEGTTIDTLLSVVQTSVYIVSTVISFYYQSSNDNHTT